MAAVIAGVVTCKISFEFGSVLKSKLGFAGKVVVRCPGGDQQAAGGCEACQDRSKLL